MLPSKAFSMSELDIYQILSLKIYKNYKNGGKMTLMDIELVLTWIETQKFQ